MHLLQEIGSYAGLAAIPGLAVLSALYFSQARDVRRLREWAGRAPERAAEMAQGGRVVARPAAEPVAQPAAQPAAAEAKPAAAAAAAAPAATAAATGPAAATAAGATAAGGGGSATAAPPRPATPAGASAGSAAPAAVGNGGGAGAGGGTTAGPRRITPRVPGAGHTAILGQGAPSEPDPWYRRLGDRLPPLRYLAILLVGIAVVGGGIAYGITQLGKDNTSSGTQQTSSPKSKHGNIGAPDKPKAISPGDVSVSVLNGTTVSGLAHTFGSKLESAGFKVINLVTAQSQVNESVVLFKSGANREARTVADKLHINNIQPANSEAASLAGNADVIVEIGADQAPAQETVPAPTPTTPTTSP